MDIPEDYGVSESVPSQSQLDAYFSAIDVETCDESTLPAYAAHQKRRQSCCPFNTKAMIPKDAFQSTSPEFRKVWSSQDDDVKVKLIKSIQNAAVLSPTTPTAVDANAAVSTAMVP